MVLSSWSSVAQYLRCYTFSQKSTWNFKIKLNIIFFKRYFFVLKVDSHPVQLCKSCNNPYIFFVGWLINIYSSYLNFFLWSLLAEKTFLKRRNFSFGKNKKSDGAILGDYGGKSMTFIVALKVDPHPKQLFKPWPNNLHIFCRKIDVWSTVPSMSFLSWSSLTEKTILAGVIISSEKGQMEKSDRSILREYGGRLMIFVQFMAENACRTIVLHNAEI